MTLLTEFLANKKKTKNGSLAGILTFVEHLQCQDQNYPLDDQALLEIALSAIADAEKRINQQQNEINRLEELSTTDELTGLLNRRGLHQQLRRTMARAKRTGEAGVFVLCDINHFKVLNDTYGHGAGDKVLQELGKLFHRRLRKTDIIARHGGDEFTLILTNTTLGKARKKLKDLQQKIAASPLLWQGEAVMFSVSLGLAKYSKSSELDTLYARADAALYQDKALLKKNAKITLVKG